LPPKSKLVEVRQLGTGVHSYGVQREAATVLPVAKKDLAVPGDCGGKIDLLAFPRANCF
jgi:hypothetical protein